MVSPGKPGRGAVPLSTLIPGTAPASSISFTSGVSLPPSAAFWNRVSSNRITPEM